MDGDVKMKKSELYKECLNCGNYFKCYSYEYEKRKFCSFDCRKKYNSAKIIKKCLNCDNTFTVYKSIYHKKKYCSSQCREQYKKSHLIKECPICSKCFKVAQSRYYGLGLRFHYCSDECYKKYLENEKKKRLERIMKMCCNCGKIFYGYRHNKLDKYFCSRRCSSEYLVGEKHHSWNGGYTITTQGYKAIKINGKYVLEHRIIMENFIGRKLYSDEVVHHKDHNKLNNNIKNLELLIKQDHDRLHTIERHKSEVRFGKKAKGGC